MAAAGTRTNSARNTLRESLAACRQAKTWQSSANEFRPKKDLAAYYLRVAVGYRHRAAARPKRASQRRELQGRLSDGGFRLNYCGQEINSELKEMIRRASEGEFVRWDAESFGRAGGKETIIIDASLMPVKDEHGRVVFITAEGRDITEKKAQEREIARQREELAKLDELKTQFFANISHDLRL